MKKFDTEVQHLKYRVLKEVAKHAFNDTLVDAYFDIPKAIVPGKEATMRCCVYKERAIVEERVKVAMGGDKNNPNVIEVIDIACDECPASGYEVTPTCRGCIAHRCESVCPRGAITFDANKRAHIDKTKCVNCGMCAKVCPYSAITTRTRPCQNACKVKAIGMGEGGEAVIDNNKCIQCGACVYQCPFGAINDKSFIVDVIDMIKKSNGNKEYKVYAIVAPSIASQYTPAMLKKVITALKEVGFYSVIEAALAGDIVAYKESQEWYEKGFLTTSCCPAFVNFIQKNYPKLVDKISHNLSPMAELGKYLKSVESNCKVVFIGPCTAKKGEFQLEKARNFVDSVLTFEELQALIDAKEIDLNSLEDGLLDNASYYGRIFARSGGVAEAVKEALIEQGLDASKLNPIACDGIEACKLALIKANAGVLPNNLIEGMACVGGCIGGPCNLTHEAKDKKEVDDYGREAIEKKILDSISVLK